MDPLVFAANQKPYVSIDQSRPKTQKHECFACQDGYDRLIKVNKLKEFPCACALSSDIQMDEIRQVSDDLTEDEKIYLEYSVDPVAWADFELNWKARWYQEEILRCLKHDQKVFMSDGTVKDISKVSVGEQVVSYEHRHRAFPTIYKVTAVFDNGEQDVYRITLENGDELEVTSNHPILAHIKKGNDNLLHNCKSYLTDYCSIDDGLSIGSRVYTTNRFDVYGHTDDPDLALLLGYIGSDGYISTVGKKVLQFSNTRKQYVDEFIELLVRRFQNTRYTSTYTPARTDKKGVNHKEFWTVDAYGEVVEFLTNLGVRDKNTRESAIFSYAFKLSLKDLRLFLNRLWSGDGCVYNKADLKLDRLMPSLRLAGGSPETLKLLRLLLKKIGIQASFIYKDQKDPSSNGYSISISRTSDIAQFFEELGPIFGKEMDSLLAISQARTVLDSGTNFRKRRRFTTISRTKIMSIENIGKHKVFDITVDTRHNFIANGLIVHNCTAKKKAIRAGRRVGKSSCLGIDILHKIYNNSDFRALVIAPYQDQVDLLFDNIDKLIENSLTLKSMVTRRIKHPSQRVEFSNGSVIVGSTAGVKTGARANKVRGQDAHGIWLDEIDMLAQEDLESILAILASHADCSLWVSGTPSGKREHFFRWCTDKSQKFKEFHYPSSVSPSWTQDIDDWFKSVYSKTAFAQEFLAEFGEEVAGVFPKPLVDDSMKDYDPILSKKEDRKIYGLGVDWNDTTEGVHMVIVSFDTADEKFWFERKYIVAKMEFTQTKAVEKIIELNEYWKFSFIYVDQGFGNTQVEMLRQYGIKSPVSGLARKVKGIQMGAKVAMMTPMGVMDKEVKPYMVHLSVLRFEQGKVVLPKIEYKGEGTEGLVDQIMKYRIKRFSPEGRPVYDNTPDHTLTAWMLAIYGFWMEHSEIGKHRGSTTIGIIHGEQKKDKLVEPSMLGMVKFEITGERAKQKKADDSNKLLPRPRNVTLRRSTGTLTDLYNARQEKGRLQKEIGRSGPIGFFNKLANQPFKRKTF